MLPDPNGYASIGWILVGLAGLLVIARNAVGFWRDVSRPSGADAMAHAQIQFQPRGDYVEREELEGKIGGLTAELHSIRGEITDLEHRQTLASDERIRSVHARLDVMPDRIIAQLSNLGVLRRPEA